MKPRRLTWLVLAALPLLADRAAAGGDYHGYSTTLVDVVLNATERFKDPDQATAIGVHHGARQK